MGILIDSSIYISWVREKIEFLPIVLQARQAQTVYICGIVEAEVTRGIKNIKHRDTFMELASLLENISITNQMWQDIGMLGWTLGRKGITISLSDLAIAHCAKKVGAKIISLDSDFKRIPEINIAKHI